MKNLIVAAPASRKKRVPASFTRLRKTGRKAPFPAFIGGRFKSKEFIKNSVALGTFPGTIHPSMKKFTSRKINMLSINEKKILPKIFITSSESSFQRRKVCRLYCINLLYTWPSLRKAQRILYHGRRDGLLLYSPKRKYRPYAFSIISFNLIFIGTDQNMDGLLADASEICEGYYVDRRWFGGTLTNLPTMKKRITYMVSLRKKINTPGFLSGYTKKECASYFRALDRLELNLGGLTGIKYLPDLAIIVDSKKVETACFECRKLRIPSIGLLDTDCNTNLVNLIIPCNTKSVIPVSLVLKYLTLAYLTGKKESFFKRIW